MQGKEVEYKCKEVNDVVKLYMCLRMKLYSLLSREEKMCTLFTTLKICLYTSTPNDEDISLLKESNT